MLSDGEGESGITFDNISADSPSVDSIDPDEQHVPEVDLDKQADVGSEIADEKKSEEPKESRPKESEPKGKEQPSEEEVVEALLNFGDEKFALKELLENPQELNRLQELIKNGALMRSDYSKKTAAHSDAVRAWEKSRDADIAHFQNYLSETNRVFNGSPMAFLKQSFSRDQNGQLLSPEVVEGRMKDWVNKLSDQLEKGSEYDPESDMKQFEIERRLNEIEYQKQQEAQRKIEAERARQTNVLSEHIVESVLKSMPTDESMVAFLEGMPGLKKNMVEAIINQVDKDFDNQYREGDPTWDDKGFIDMYNFKKLWDEQQDVFQSSWDKSYEAYLAKKKAGSGRKVPKGNPSNANSGSDDRPWTFGRMFS